MRNVVFAVLVASSSVVSYSEAAAQTATLKKTQIQSLSSPKGTCGYFTKAWKAAKKINGSKYEVLSSAPSSLKIACSRLIKPGSAKSLTALADVSKIVTANSAASGRVSSASGVGIRDVSGTPPTLAEIIAGGAETTFWQAGTVAAVAGGSPSNDQCNDFLGSSNDGASGGFLSCYMTEGVGYSVGQIAQAGTTMCYMRSFPTQEVQDAGAVTVVSGTLPGDNISNLFNTPTGSAARVVKIQTAGEEQSLSIYLRIKSASQNAAAGNQYAFEYFACEPGQSSPQEYESVRISAGGEFISSALNSDGQGGIYGSTVRAFLSRSGAALAIDSRRARIAAFTGVRDVNESFKSLISINGSNEIRSKVYDRHSGFSPRKAYSISRFSGSGVADLRFFEGAYKDDGSGNAGFNGAAEYRDSFYARATANSYISDLSEVNFATDSFYQSAPEVTGTLTEFSCDIPASIVLNLNMDSPEMQAIRVSCEGGRIDGNSARFCRSTALQNAQTGYQSSCVGQ